MTKFKIVLDVRAVQDIQEAIDYYNQQKSGLGEYFLKSVNHSFSVLKDNPFYQIRYDGIRCLPIKKFPYMTHFVVDEIQSTVKIYALINTHRDPEEFWKK